MFFTKLILYLCACLLVGFGKEISAWGSSDKVKLKEVEVLTLYSGRMTAGRRSSPVPQLKCVGGNAGCNTFIPQVVQCYNRGFDGTDVQWECKTDMDNAYRFGNIQVSCEGYDYPEDPYILKGSCGLEYTIDLTKEGMNNQGGHNYYGNSYQQQQPYGFSSHKGSHKSSYYTNLACGVVICIIVYAIYKTCITPPYDETRQRSSTNQDYPDHRGPGSSPPPPGFRRNYYPDQSNDFSGSDSCSGGASSSRRAGGGLGGAGGFWTGAATGGLLGYMFGARNNTAGYSGGYTGGFGSARRGFGDSWGGGGGGFSGGGFSGGGSSSSGSRSASGFGGTSRR